MKRVGEVVASLLVMMGVVLIGRSGAMWALVVGCVLVTIGVRMAIDVSRL